jgi:hypothetical protein
LDNKKGDFVKKSPLIPIITINYTFKLHLFGLKFRKKPSVYPDTGGFSSKFYPQKSFAQMYI